MFEPVLIYLYRNMLDCSTDHSQHNQFLLPETSNKSLYTRFIIKKINNKHKRQTNGQKYLV